MPLCEASIGRMLGLIVGGQAACTHAGLMHGGQAGHATNACCVYMHSYTGCRRLSHGEGRLHVCTYFCTALFGRAARIRALLC